MTNSTRISSISLYSDIARENSEKMAFVEAQISALEARIANSTVPDEFPELEFELMSLQDLRGKHALIVIVFSAIAIESYIYDYAARHFSDNFVQDYLDKLDVIGKLVVIPRLITGKELSRNRKWFSLIKNIVKSRNLIVHSKSSTPPFTAEGAQRYLKKIKNTDELFLQSARHAVELLDTLVVEISVLDPDEEIWVEGYLAKRSQ
jgi:hypothetical protein